VFAIDETPWILLCGADETRNNTFLWCGWQGWRQILGVGYVQSTGYRFDYQPPRRLPIETAVGRRKKSPGMPGLFLNLLQVYAA
jgi:hypothetical protein